LNADLLAATPQKDTPCEEHKKINNDHHFCTKVEPNPTSLFLPSMLLPLHDNVVIDFQHHHPLSTPCLAFFLSNRAINDLLHRLPIVDHHSITIDIAHISLLKDEIQLLSSLSIISVVWSDYRATMTVLCATGLTF